MTNRKMAWTLKNLELAYTQLTAEGLLVSQSKPEPTTEPAPPVPPRTEENAPVPTRTRGPAELPSTITGTDTAPSENVRSGNPPAAATAKMTAAEFKTALEKWPDLLKR